MCQLQRQTVRNWPFILDTAALLAAYSGWSRGMRDRVLSLTDSDICHTK